MITLIIILTALYIYSVILFIKAKKEYTDYIEFDLMDICYKKMPLGWVYYFLISNAFIILFIAFLIFKYLP